MPTYAQFKIRHEKYDADYWTRCKALYAGGRELLANDALMKDIFPRHQAEEPFVYEERRRRAYYIPYPGQIIDFIVAQLGAQQVTLKPEPDVDPFYERFVEDISPPGGRRQSLNDLLKEQIREALKVQTAWTLVDLPRRPDELPLETLADEELSGALRAYAIPIDPRNVLDWEEDEFGELLWALTVSRTRRRVELEADRSLVREEFTYYTRDAWVRYLYLYPADKPPKDKDEPLEVIGAVHTFGKVPLVRLEVPDGLWAMNKVEGVAREHLNKRNALSWAQYKSLFPIMAAFLQPATLQSPKSDDPKRAVNQRVGQGRIWVGAKEDRLEFIGPDAGPYVTAANDLATLRDEMHRVLHAMAQSIDNSGAALQRSADSKGMDQAATAVVLGALGCLAREHAIQIMEMAQRGRRDPTLAKWTAQGMEDYDETSVSGLVEEAEHLEIISIPSATFQVAYKERLVKRILGGDADDEMVAKIRKELESNISNEMFMPPTVTPEEDAAVEAEPAAGKPPPEKKPAGPPVKGGVA